MPGEPEKAEMTALIAWLGMRKKTNNPAVLFLGARAGGLFRSRAFYETLKPFSKRTLNDLAPAEQFGECYRLLSQGQFSESDRNSILTDSLRNIMLTDADISLAEMVKNKLFDVIISTNVDDLLEEAFAQVEMREIFDYDVFIPERTPSEESFSHERRLSCKIIKSFGALSSRKYSITERGVYLDDNPKLRNLLETHLARDVLVVGLDPVWDEEMVRMFPTHGETIWFVSEEEWSPPHPILHMARVRQIKYLAGSEGSYESFWKAAHWHLHEEMPMGFQLTQSINRQLQTLSREVQLLKKAHQDIHNDVKVLLAMFQAIREEQSGESDKRQKLE
ncbi:MAG: hypothetical protein JOZ18_06425 [Chloroflexi bacterium]|nr:hypothetical protein [Chloroflexota bacterium]